MCGGMATNMPTTWTNPVTHSDALYVPLQEDRCKAKEQPVILKGGKSKNARMW